MATLQPVFELTIGSLRSTTDNPVAGPQSFIVERDMDVAVDSLQVTLMERADVRLADPVTLDLGHDGENERVFTGTVVGLRPTISRVAVIALGTMHALLSLSTASTFENQTAGSIVRTLIGEAGLTAGTVDDGPALPRFAIDRSLSAYAHAKGLADRLGYELYTDRNGEIMFHALGEAANLDAAGGLGGAVAGAVSGLLGGSGEGYLFGQHLIAAHAASQPPAWASVDVGGESPMSRQGDTTSHWLTTNDSDYRGSAGSGDPNLLVLDPAARTRDLADRFAAGHLATKQRTAHQVIITVLGRPQLDLGDSITVGDVPDGLMNGDGYVRAIRHRFSVAYGFLTDFRIGMGAGS
jgi:hypothetical protein